MRAIDPGQSNLAQSALYMRALKGYLPGHLVYLNEKPLQAKGG